jgi:formylglycine-generating enzyme
MVIRERWSSRFGWFALPVVSAGCQLIAGLTGERELALASAGGAETPGKSSVLPGVGGDAGLFAGAPTSTAAGNDGSATLAGGAVGRGGADAEAAGSPDSLGQAGAGLDESIPLTSASCAGLVPRGCGTVDPCRTIPVLGGTFHMGRNEDGTRADYYPTGAENETPERLVTVSPFVLDKYEVTVGRFRRFVLDYTMPKAGSGQHPAMRGSGWNADWNAYLPADGAALASSLVVDDDGHALELATWTDQPGLGDCRPINTINWFVAFAFCIWDGGRLPTEAEWEFAAAGGDEERFFPWGTASPNKRAVFGCSYSESFGCTPGDLPRIGSLSPAGDGRFGQADLAGSVGEPTRDSFTTQFYASPQGTGTDVANLDFYGTDPPAAFRGGGAVTAGDGLRSVARSDRQVLNRGEFYGVRCARNP